MCILANKYCKQINIQNQVFTETTDFYDRITLIEINEIGTVRIESPYANELKRAISKLPKKYRKIIQ